MVKKILCISLILVSLVGLSVIIKKSYFSSGIYTYNAPTDKEFIIKLFKDNWYWLVSENSVDFSPEYMLDNKASSRAIKHYNNLTINTYRIAGKPVGFEAHYMQSLFEGFILFLAVDSQYRGKGYARQLLQTAIKDLKSRGATTINLITRVVNTPAQKLYKSAGFEQIWTDGKFVRFQLKNF